MGNYVDENLGTGEQVRYSARISLWKYVLNFLIGGVLFLGSLSGLIAWTSVTAAWIMGLMALVAVVLLVWPFIARRTTELVVTDKRLIAKYGVVSTQSIEIRFDKIETVRVTQGIGGRLLNFGDIIVTGTGSTFDPIPDISRPMAFRTALNQAMELRSPGAKATV